MSDYDFINEKTLKFLMNPKIKTNSTESSKKTIKPADRKFYKKRILYLTNELLLNKKNPQILEHGEKVIEIFQQYLATCIGYFKHLDMYDICQEEYKDFEQNENEQNEYSEDWREKDKAIILSLNHTNTQKKIMKQFLSISKKKGEEKEIEEESKKEEIISKIYIPQKKKIKLKTEELKTKGIIKKEKKIIQQDYIDKHEETEKNNETETKTINENLETQETEL